MNNVYDLSWLGFRLRNTFPTLGNITPLYVLGEGFSSIAIETAEGIVLRIAKNNLAMQGHIKEAVMLPILSKYLPIPVPNPLCHVPASDDFPFGVIGYRKLEGRSLDRKNVEPVNQIQIATALANFLHVLHSFPVEQVVGVSLIRLEYYIALRDDVLPPLRNSLTEIEYLTIVRWWDRFLADEKAKIYKPVLQHGDLWYENILIDEPARTITGIIDFEAMAIGDAAADFAALLYLGEPFVAQVIQLYTSAGSSLGEKFLYRLNQLWELRDFGGVQYSIKSNDMEELIDSIQKIRKGPILDPRKFCL